MLESLARLGLPHCEQLGFRRRSIGVLAAVTSNTTVTYPNLRMKANYDAMSGMATDYQSYVANDLIPPILDYFSAALNC